MPPDAPVGICQSEVFRLAISASEDGTLEPILVSTSTIVLVLGALGSPGVPGCPVITGVPNCLRKRPGR